MVYGIRYMVYGKRKAGWGRWGEECCLDLIPKYQIPYTVYRMPHSAWRMPFDSYLRKKNFTDVAGEFHKAEYGIRKRAISV